MNSALVTAALIAVLSGSACVSQQAVKQAAQMRTAIYNLKRMHDDVKKVYYDPKLRGLDMDARYDTALMAVSQSTSEQQRFKALSNYLLALDDSHTRYIGGTPVDLRDFGLSFRFYGGKPFVSAVDAWAPASVKQLHRGDEIVKFAGQTVTRENYRRVLVDFLGQHPIPDLALEIRAPDRSERTVTIPADTAAWRKLNGKQYRALERSVQDSLRRAFGHVTARLQNRVFVWKLPEFEDADLAIGKVARAAAKYETVILDMRGNPGGPIARLEEVLGYFIERPVNIGTMKMRWDEERFTSRPKRDRLTNNVIVLVDSETASAAEVFTRLLQLDKRATVIGDRTMGAVMASMRFGYASITVSDFVLHNGERLEKVGVQPDVVVIPTPQEMFDGYDAVLAYAINSAGVRITPAQAAMVLQGK